MIRKSKKGFTLIELLAVIVILALLVLVATPAITNIITNATKNNFKNEVVGIVSNMETAFADKMSKPVGDTAGLATDAKIHSITIDGKGYAYLCMTLNQLVTSQYIKKNLGTGYAGYIQMFVPDGTGATINYVNVTNGRYYLQGQVASIEKEGWLPSQTAAAEGVTKPTSDLSCPSSVSALPTAHNVQE